MWENIYVLYRRKEGRETRMGVMAGEHVVEMKRMSEKKNVDVWEQGRCEAYSDRLQ
jgi:hypothetical protein